MRSCLQASRKVRSWLECYVLLVHYWKAFLDLPSPKELQRLLEVVFCGEGLYLCLH